MNSIVNMASDSGKKGTGLSYNSSGTDEYDKLYKANPYVGLTYNKSAWQSFLGNLGFRTDYDRWLEEAQVNANEYDAQVASMKMQNEYNSPAQEASRMRQAGLNPDLTGLENVAESASPGQDPQGMSPGAGESGEFGEITQKIWNFGTSVMNMYQIGVGFAKDMMSYKQMKSAVDSQDVSLAKDFMSFADEYFKKSLPDKPFTIKDEENEWLANMGKWTLEYPKKLKFNRRQRRIWQNSIGEYYNSDIFRKMMEDYRATSDAMTGYAKNQFKPMRFGPKDDSDQWQTFQIVSDNLGNLADELYKIQMKNYKDVAEAGSATAKYQKDVADAHRNYVDPETGLSGAQTATIGEMSSHKLLWYNNQIEKAMNSTLRNLVTDLERQANDGDLLSAGLLLAFQIFRMSNFKFK